MKRVQIGLFVAAGILVVWLGLYLVGCGDGGIEDIVVTTTTIGATTTSTTIPGSKAISGTVRFHSSGGAGIEGGVAVTLLDSGTSDIIQTVTADANNGSYVFSNVEPGDYRIEGIKENWDITGKNVTLGTTSFLNADLFASPTEWDVVNFGASDQVLHDVVSPWPGRAYAAGEDNGHAFVLCSIDSGESWHRVTDPPADPCSTVFRNIDHQDTGIKVVDINGGLWRAATIEAVSFTTNWQKQEDKTFAPLISDSGLNRIYKPLSLSTWEAITLDGKKVLITRNGTSAWEDKTPSPGETYNDICSSVLLQGGIVLGDNAKAYFTTDWGETWSNVATLEQLASEGGVTEDLTAVYFLTDIFGAPILYGIFGSRNGSIYSYVKNNDVPWKKILSGIPYSINGASYAVNSEGIPKFIMVGENGLILKEK